MNLVSIQQQMRLWLARPGHGEWRDTTQPARYQVPHNNYQARLTRCLEASYPVLRDWLGPNEFLQACTQHIDAHCAHNLTPDAYGVDFQSTLLDRYPDHPVVHELAWIEGSLSESFVAADAPVLSPGVLGEIDEDEVHLLLAASVRLCRATTNAAALWQAWQDNLAMPESAMLATAGGLITLRHGYNCRPRQLDATEYAALLLLRDDSRLATLSAALMEHLGEAAGVHRTGELLAGWLRLGIVRPVTILRLCANDACVTA